MPFALKKKKNCYIRLDWTFLEGILEEGALELNLEKT
jgi:hypothetical protein